MKLQTIKYADYEKELPQTGEHILAQQTANNTLFVYQAYHPAIANYAVEAQQLGGPHFKLSRMSWIKPNFLWMMYRCGWAMKENQERVLALEITRAFFNEIISQAVPSSFQASQYKTQEDWKTAIEQSDVRLQWDPDHAPNGGKLERRAIQLGMRAAVLRSFAQEQLVSVTDITDFVATQRENLAKDRFHLLEVPEESVYLSVDFE